MGLWILILYIVKVFSNIRIPRLSSSPRYCCAKQSKHYGIVSSEEGAGATEGFQYLSRCYNIRITVVYGPYINDYFKGADFRWHLHQPLSL
jgi:hypothetical protein